MPFAVLIMKKMILRKSTEVHLFHYFFSRNGLYVSIVCVVYFVCTLGVLHAEGDAWGKRIRDAALYTFVYHYTFAAKSKSLII